MLVLDIFVYNNQMQKESSLELAVEINSNVKKSFTNGSIRVNTPSHIIGKGKRGRELKEDKTRTLLH